MIEKYLVYAFYRHRQKFIKQFDSFEDAERFNEQFTAQEKKEQNGFEFCYIELVERRRVKS